MIPHSHRLVVPFCLLWADFRTAPSYNGAYPYRNQFIFSPHMKLFIAIAARKQLRRGDEYLLRHCWHPFSDERNINPTIEARRTHLSGGGLMGGVVMPGRSKAMKLF